MAKAVLIKKTGGPEVLELTNINFREPKKNEVFVRHKAIGVNYLDIEQRTGAYNLKENTSKLKLPAVIGAEAVGIAEKIGEGSACDIKQGDRVCYCNIPYGAYSEARLMNAKYLVKPPETLSDEVIAASFYKGLLSLYLTSRIYFIRDGITVMVHDATSDMGNLLCQWIKAKSLKCKIIGTVSSQKKIKLAEDLGCDLVINYKDNQDILNKKVMEFTNGYGVSAVYDSVGHDTYLLSLNSLCVFGLYILYEQRSGQIPAMSWKAFRSKSLFFTYPSLFHYTQNVVDFAMTAAEVFYFLEHGKIKPNIAEKCSLQDVANLHQKMESGNLLGSAVIKF